MDGLDDDLREWAAAGRLRSLRTVTPLPRHRAIVDGRDCLNLASNDYLGFGCDPETLRAFHGSSDAGDASMGFAASASRLLSGNHPAYGAMEETLESAYGSGRRALVVNSGYHANIGILPALAGRGDLILSDRLNHASLLDGIRLSRADSVRYRHRDYAHLRELLAARRARARRAFIVTESVFSMDGDRADLRELARIKREFDAALYVDEAHAVGIAGRSGLGLCEEAGVAGDVDILLGTFGKALASTGAFVICEAACRDCLVNAMRSFIYTTALPPVVLGWSRHVYLRALAADDRRERLSRISENFRRELAASGVPTMGDTHIVPAIVGDDHKAVALADRLRERGFYCPAVRPPTVPDGTARLRISLGAGMESAELSELAKAIAEGLRS